MREASSRLPDEPDEEAVPASAQFSSVAKGLERALQENNRYRPLDSLDTVIAKSYFGSLGVEVKDDFVAEPNTIAGWLKWYEQTFRTP